MMLTSTPALCSARLSAKVRSGRAQPAAAIVRHAAPATSAALGVLAPARSRRAAPSAARAPLHVCASASTSLVAASSDGPAAKDVGENKAYLCAPPAFPGAARAGADATPPRSGITLVLWYFFNAVFAIFNKKTLNVFPYPWLLSWVQVR